MWGLNEISMNYIEPKTGCFLNYTMAGGYYMKQRVPPRCSHYWDVEEHRTDSAAQARKPTSLYLG